MPIPTQEEAEAILDQVFKPLEGEGLHFEFNINEYVEVKLTERGRKIHRKIHDDLFASMDNPPIYTPPKEDEEGWSKWQMWSLMQNFGEAIYMGAPEQPFETVIRIHQVSKPLD